MMWHCETKLLRVQMIVSPCYCITGCRDVCGIETEILGSGDGCGTVTKLMGAGMTVAL